MYSLYIADDEKNVVFGLQKNLKWKEMGLKICGTAFNGSNAYADIVRLNPDFALIDVRMPGMSGLEIIQKLQGKVDTLFLVISGYDEFDYVKKSMDLDVVEYILKPSTILEIERAFIKAINRRHNIKLMEGYYGGSKGKQETTDTFLSLLKMFPDLECFYAFMCIRIGFKNTKFLSDYLELIRDIEQLELGDNRIFHYQVSGGISIIIGFKYTKNLNKLRLKIEKQILSIINSKQDQIYYGFGNMVFLVEEIEISISKANTLLDYYMFTEIEPQCIRERMLQTKKPVQDMLITLSEKIIRSRGDFSLDSEIENFLICLMNGELDSGQIKWLCADLIYNIQYKVLNEYNLNISNNILKTSVNNRLQSIKKMDELKTLMCRVLTSLRECISASQSEKEPNVIRQIKQYIKENIDSHFTLESISDVFYLNPAYVSYMFKKETGANLFSYIAEQRIKKAKYLIRNTNGKISDIALAVGYRDQRYFCQVFKQRCGMNATDYRNQR